jgi:hypothetical protein
MEKVPICLLKYNDKYIEGPLGIRIDDPILNEELKQVVLGFWVDRKNNHFPGPLPVSIERKNLYKLKKYPYLVCMKSDGVRLMMLCYDKSIYMVNRAFVFYKVDQYFKYIFNGQTEVNKCYGLFDGELVLKNEKDWCYIIYDCISINYNDVSQETLYSRHNHVKNFIELWSPKQTNVFSISFKNFYKFSEIDKMINDIKTLDHKEDGLIFTPATLPVGTQTQYTLFKWKNNGCHTFDFKVHETDSEIILYVIQDSYDIKFASIEKNSENGKMFINLLREKHPSFKNGEIVECGYDENTKRYIPHIHRLDKTHPNSLFTVNKIILNAKENITLEEIITFIKSRN